MNNATKTIAALLIIALMLTAGGFFYHKTMEKESANVTPTDNGSNAVPNGTMDVPGPSSQPVVDTEFSSIASAIYQTARQQWSTDARDDQQERSYCNVEGCTNSIVGTYNGFSYYITVSNANVTKYYITNGEKQFAYSGEGLALENIAPVNVSDVDSSQVVSITPNM